MHNEAGALGMKGTKVDDKGAGLAGGVSGYFPARPAFFLLGLAFNSLEKSLQTG
jgi:hypothetical protein